MISWFTTVKKIEAKRRAVRAFKTGRKTEDGKDEITVEYEEMGHGLLLEGEGQWHIFKDPPPFEVGDMVKITVQKVER